MHIDLHRTTPRRVVNAHLGDYAVIDVGRKVGRIYEDQHDSQPWFWSILVVGACHAGKTSGRAASLSEAKAEFQAIIGVGWLGRTCKTRVERHMTEVARGRSEQSVQERS